MATLHNQDQVAAKDVRPGDTVIVRRAGDVIPEVVGPVLSDRDPSSQSWVFPSDCPVCGERLVRDEAAAARGRAERGVREVHEGAREVTRVVEKTIVDGDAKACVSIRGDVPIQ